MFDGSDEGRMLKKSESMGAPLDAWLVVERSGVRQTEVTFR